MLLIRRITSVLSAIGLAIFIVPAFAQPQPRTDWGAPLVTVTQAGNTWTIAGKKHTATLDATNLALAVKAGATTWSMVPSAATDMVVKSGAEEFPVRLADAQKITIVPYATGARTGVKLTLSQWKNQTTTADLTVYLTLALEGKDEELVFTVAADEHAATVRRLDWPTALDGSTVDYTVLNHYRGILLPRTWPTEYNPIRGDSEFRKDSSEIQSDVVECWSQSWWGFQKGTAAMMIIIETSDDAAYQWSHPAGGPTVIGPRWRAQLGKLGYPRGGRMVFFEKGNYVDLAKRYRVHAQDTGLWVSLKEKIAREPRVENLIGTIEARVSVLRDIVPESRLYNKEKPETNYRLTPFATIAKQMRDLKAKGIERFNLVLTGWPHKGYDREHPDTLPVAPAAGGWEGLKLIADTCKELGYTFTLHDQYRDYYVEAPSFKPEFAVYEETEGGAPTIFPGTRFGSWKEGRSSYLAAWDGGKQTYLGPRFMFEHWKKNYTGIFDQGIRPGGSYLDVFGYVPPDQDFNPEHPTTRTEAKNEIAKLYRWARNHLGVVGTEAGVDWTVPYSDYSSPLGPGKAGIPVPLFSLVYHDAVMTPYSPSGGEARMNRDDRPDWLYGMLNGGPPRTSTASIIPRELSAEEAKNPTEAQRTAVETSRKTVERVRPILQQMTTLHKRVALLEMTNHEFLDADNKKERSTFSDGTTVTIDWTAKTADVKTK